AITEGILPVEQDRTHMATVRDVIEALDDFRLAALQAVTTASGSVAIGLALWDNAIEPDMAWRVAQIEEDFQIGFWGDDPNAIIMREGRKQTMMAGADLFRFLNQ
ncbi:MAG TPA: ATPase, partial [Alphaproteobacteria bacterium]|nr:ATPase [Alphaproteobacteria bacterium]